MSNKKKSVEKDICNGCLTVGRKLLPIKQHMRLYKKLMADFFKEQTTPKTSNPKLLLMCWECRSVLRNTERFRKRARQAHEILFLQTKTDNIKIFNHPLSTLTTTQVSNTPDYEITYDCKIEEKATNSLIDEKLESTELKVEFPADLSDIKDDAHIEIKLENDYDDVNDITYSDNEDLALGGVKTEPNLDKEIRKQRAVDKRKQSMKSKFKLIHQDESEKQSFDEVVVVKQIDREELNRCLEQARNRGKYVKAPMKCETCVAGFFNERLYKNHLMKFHSQLKNFVCEICSNRLQTKAALMAHMKSHVYKYTCQLCGYECLKRMNMAVHLEYAHYRYVECLKCGLKFQFREFYDHYNSMHRRVECDHCGYRTLTKKNLINHISKKHSQHKCPFCGKVYSIYYTMTRHIQLRHTKVPTEDAFCVECDIQFENTAQYKYHLHQSAKHKPKVGYPCPECNKVYAKNIGMKNHYKHVHTQKTDYYCEKCCRFFLNGYRLRTHTATFHNNIRPPKDKFCPHCGRGFVTNRILINHIRTHTGERPHLCVHCSATFAQKTALVAHTRSIHKVMVRYSEVE